MKTILWLSVFFLLILAILFCSDKREGYASVVTSRETIIDKDFVLLFLRHVIYTRLYYSTENEVYLERLEKNSEDIGNAIGQAFNLNEGRYITSILKERIDVITKLLDLYKRGRGRSESINEKLDNSSKNLAKYLSSMNQRSVPENGWEYEPILSMLRNYDSLLSQQIKFHLAGDIRGENYKFDLALVKFSELGRYLLLRIPTAASNGKE